MGNAELVERCSVPVSAAWFLGGEEDWMSSMSLPEKEKLKVDILVVVGGMK